MIAIIFISDAERVAIFIAERAEELIWDLSLMFQFFKTKPKTLGEMGEEQAQKEYVKRGFKVIARNEFNKKGKRFGEIDFIAKNEKQIIFVEVKTRTSGSQKFGSGVEAVDVYKQRKLLLAVKMFLVHNQQYLNLQPQIDVCIIEYSEIDKLFKDAIIITNAVEDFN